LSAAYAKISGSGFVGAAHVTRVAEEVRRAPEQPHLGALHFLLRFFDEAIEIRGALLQARALVRHVAIVEREVRDADFSKNSYAVSYLSSAAATDRRSEPRRSNVWEPEDVVTAPRERVPVTNGNAQVLFEGLTQDDLLLVV
jgi:hypothetical protein